MYKFVVHNFPKNFLGNNFVGHAIFLSCPSKSTPRPLAYSGLVGRPPEEGKGIFHYSMVVWVGGVLQKVPLQFHRTLLGCLCTRAEGHWLNKIRNRASSVPIITPACGVIT